MKPVRGLSSTERCYESLHERDGVQNPILVALLLSPDQLYIVAV